MPLGMLCGSTMNEPRGAKDQESKAHEELVLSPALALVVDTSVHISTHMHTTLALSRAQLKLQAAGGGSRSAKRAGIHHVYQSCRGTCKLLKGRLRMA